MPWPLAALLGFMAVCAVYLFRAIACASAIADDELAAEARERLVRDAVARGDG